MKEQRITELMHSVKVPGLTILTLKDGVQSVSNFGVQSLETKTVVHADTVFEAASLSKPVVAHAALQLVDAGSLDLNEPLASIIGPLVPGDAGTSSITAHHVLSHTTGLPNWRRDQFPLRTYFSPGSRFSYSGEGFVYLQAALEKLTGERLEAMIERLVLAPLGMQRSSFVWRDGFEGSAAFGHRADGSVEPKFRPGKANAAFSLHTTAADYGRFVVAAMDGALLSAEMGGLWFRPQAHPPLGSIEDLGKTPTRSARGVAWGLGWGLEPEISAFFHWGSNPGATAFVFGVTKTRAATIIFMNGDSGLNIVPHLIEPISSKPHPSLAWLGLPASP